MRQFFTLFILTTLCGILFPMCSDEYAILECNTDLKEDLADESLTRSSQSCGFDSIIPLEGDSMTMRKEQVKTLALSLSSNLYEELSQLDQIPVYLQIKGNTTSRNFLNANGEGIDIR